MPRVRLQGAELASWDAQRGQQQKLAAELDALIAPKSKRRRMKPARQVVDEVSEMIQTRDWKRATGNHFVELYAWCHRRVYGLDVEEIRGSGKAATTARKAAVAAAGRMLHGEFNEPGQMAAYIAWAFKREEGREEWRKENNPESSARLTWRALFASKSVLTDYRLAKARSRK